MQKKKNAVYYHAIRESVGKVQNLMTHIAGTEN